jgi:hypothetical protein
MCAYKLEATSYHSLSIDSNNNLITIKPHFDLQSRRAARALIKQTYNFTRKVTRQPFIQRPLSQYNSMTNEHVVRQTERFARIYHVISVQFINSLDCVYSVY